MKCISSLTLNRTPVHRKKQLRSRPRLGSELYHCTIFFPSRPRKNCAELSETKLRALPDTWIHWMISSSERTNICTASRGRTHKSPPFHRPFTTINFSNDRTGLERFGFSSSQLHECVMTNRMRVRGGFTKFSIEFSWKFIPWTELFLWSSFMFIFHSEEKKEQNK